MPFTPEGFYLVAKKLSVGELPLGEGRYRTVAGRAYYGAFWATCVAICRKYKINPPRNMPHKTLCDELARTSGDEEMAKLGNLLNSLRLTRVHADYNLLQPLIEHRADDAVEDAQKVLEMIPTVEDRLPKVDPH